jgi:O-antigen/teichoic acid export membrane protein
MWKRIPGVVIKKMPFRNSAMWSASSNMWVVNIMSLIVDYSGVLVAGALVASQELAYLFSAQRTALLVSFVLVVVNTVVAPHYARLWNTGDLKSIQYTAKQSTRVMAISALLIVLLMSFFSGLIMSLFGEGFEQGAKLLVILAIGQLVNVTTGSVGYLLTMTGHERDMRQVSIISGPITVICAVWFTVCWGVTGAACATALGLSLKNLGALLMVKRRLGFWPLG